MKRAYADTSFGQVHYRTEGSGPTLLLMHASNHSSHTFSKLIPLLSAEYRVVAPDYLGFGASDPLPDDVTLSNLALSMGELLDEVGDGTGHVFGLHTGNKIGAVMGAETPDRVDDLVLCGQPHSIIPDEEERNAVIRGRVADSIPEYPKTSDGSHHLKAWADLKRRVMDAWWDPSILSEEGFTAERTDLLATHVVEKLQVRGSLAGMYAANFASDWTDALSRIEARTFILELADQEELERYGLQGDRVASLLQDGEWTPLEGVDASVFYKSPEMIAEPVREFLD